MATGKMQKFVAAYLSNGLNATEAAKTAGYSEKTAYSIGSRLLRNVEVRAEVDAALRESAMSRDEVLHRISEQARGSIFDVSEVTVIDAEQGYVQVDPSLAAALANGKGHLIQSVDYDKEGRLKLKLYSSQRALDMLAKAHGIYSEPVDGDQGRFDEYLKQIEEARAKFDGEDGT